MVRRFHPSVPIRDRILGGIAVDEKTGCWNWTRAHTTYGYGVIRLLKKNIGAHRVSYAQFIGEIPLGMFVCHRCDNPSCVNPEHLFLGTTSDNMRDSSSKGRHKHQKHPEVSIFNKKGPLPWRAYGEGHGMATLDTKTVLKIKSLCDSGMPACKVARIFGRASSTVKRIRSGTTWKHLWHKET